MALFPDLKANALAMLEVPLFIEAGNFPKFSTLQVDKLIATRSDQSIKFYVVATPALAARLNKNQDGFSKAMPKKLRRNLATGQGVLIDQQMIVDMVRGTLDEGNKLILKNCDIRVDGLYDGDLWKREEL